MKIEERGNCERVQKKENARQVSMENKESARV